MPNKNDILRLYGQYSVELARHLKETTLNAEEQMYLENHLLVVQLALALSKHAMAKRPAPVREE